MKLKKDQDALTKQPKTTIEHQSPLKSFLNYKPVNNPLAFNSLLIVFLVGSIFGCYYEVILNFITRLIENGEFFWETRSGVLYGPFSTIYGIGAILMTIALVGRNLKWCQVFIIGAIVDAAFEYIFSYLQEFFTGTTSWDYSNHFLNFDGRTSVQVMITWGVICLFYVYIAYPLIDRLITLFSNKTGKLILRIVAVLLCIDLILSFSAVYRQYLRRQNIPPLTFYGRFIDEAYTDERLKKAFPNMYPI